MNVLQALMNNSSSVNNTPGFYESVRIVVTTSVIVLTTFVIVVTPPLIAVRKVGDKHR